MDPRHLHHTNLYYMRCSDNGYRIHLQGKDDADYYPRFIIKCKNNYWNKYTDNVYLIYFINK